MGIYLPGRVGLTNESNLFNGRYRHFVPPKKQDTSPAKEEGFGLCWDPPNQIFHRHPGGFSFVTSHPGENWEIVSSHQICMFRQEI